MTTSKVLAVCVLAAALACERPADDVAPTTRALPADDEMTVYVYYHRDEEPSPLPREVQIDLERRPAGQALRQLVRGPTDEEQRSGYTSFFSPETADIVRDLRFDGRRVAIDFHDFRHLIPNASTSAGSEAFLRELNATVFQFPEIRDAEYLIDGSCEAFWNFLQRDCEVVTRDWRP
jgi:hypothetical protein